MTEEQKQRKKEYDKKYRELNRQKLIDYCRKYRQDNKERLKEFDKNRLNETRLRKRRRYKTDIAYQIKARISGHFKYCLDVYTKTGKTQQMKKYGIDVNSIIKKLGNPPQDGKIYHIDHIFPVSAFDLNNPEHIKACWHSSNLQWLEESKNLLKRNNYDKNEFQKYLEETKT